MIEKLKTPEGTITRIHYILSGLFWIHGLLVVIFNIAGLRELWDIARLPFIAIAGFMPWLHILATFFACLKAKQKKLKYALINAAALLVTIVYVVSIVIAATTWFW
jgi:hypothetical protein